MSQHSSYKSKTSLGGVRTVLTRVERYIRLKNNSEIKPGDKVTGFRKVKV